MCCFILLSKHQSIQFIKQECIAWNSAETYTEMEDDEMTEDLIMFYKFKP